MTRRLAVLPLLLIAACTSTQGGDILQLSLVEGSGQIGFAGAAVATDPAVRVTRNGEPVAGVTVQFAVSGGGGALIGDRPTTDGDGVARVTAWVLGAPGSQELVAILQGIDGAPIRITATAIHPAPALVTPVRGANQVGLVYTSTAVRPEIRVTNAIGQPVPGLSVSWVVAGNTGSTGGVRGADVLTDADGRATVSKWVLGSDPGLYVLTATVEGISVQFKATALLEPGDLPDPGEPGA
jgi:hypothetical protein